LLLNPIRHEHVCISQKSIDILTILFLLFLHRHETLYCTEKTIYINNWRHEAFVLFNRIGTANTVLIYIASQSNLLRVHVIFYLELNLVYFWFCIFISLFYHSQIFPSWYIMYLSILLSIWNLNNRYMNNPLLIYVCIHETCKNICTFIQIGLRNSIY
jgi:hypothetical protein